MPSQFPILLVDDNSSIADVLNRAAQSSFPEATFIAVSSFAEAANYLEDLEGRGPKLVLLDIDLQTGMDGLEFLSLLRNHPQGRLVPVVMLSASDQNSQIKEAFLRGASAFTAKPFSYTEWKAYVLALRLYWFQTVTVPNLWFERSADEQINK